MIYLDHAATTPILPDVVKAVQPWLTPERVGNASSIHTQGVNARRAVERARAQVAHLIGANPSEVFFTSGGTESNNIWLSSVEPCVVSPTIILTTPLEHHSVLEPIKEKKRLGVCEKEIHVYNNGVVDLDDLERNLSEHQFNIKAVSVMWVNNELGTINPIEDIGLICKKYGVPFHTDAVAAAGHIPIDVHACHVDFLSLSGHKFGALQGVGALYIANHIPKHPLLFGGGQESGVRPGTENIPGIVALGEAAEIAKRDMASNLIAWEVLRTRFIKRLESSMSGQFQVNGGDRVSPNIISLTIPGVNSESLLLKLDADGIQVSAGSACSASAHAVSHVLAGIGMQDELASSTLRISMGVSTTEEDMIATADMIAKHSEWLKSLWEV